MTRSSCLATLSCAAVLLAIAGYGCGGSSDTISGSDASGSGSGGSVGSGSGGRTGGGSGGEQGSGGTVGGSGGTIGGGSGGRTGSDGGASGGRTGTDGGFDGRPTFDGRPRDTIVRDVIVREVNRTDASGDGGAIPICRANARCQVSVPAETCMETCPAGSQGTCTCMRPGIVVCGLCRRVADGGVRDGRTGD